MVLSYNGILYSNQKEQMTGACNHIDESHRCYVEWKKARKKYSAWSSWSYLYEVQEQAK